MFVLVAGGDNGQLKLVKPLVEGARVVGGKFYTQGKGPKVIKLQIQA